MTDTLSRYKLYLRSKDYVPIEILDAFTDLTIIKRFNGVGTWSLEVPTSAKIARYITPDVGIIVQRDNQTIFSGPSGFTPNSYEETKETIIISGVDDNVLLETPARPVPSASAPPYADEYYVETGVASTVMFSLVERNIGSLAPTVWKIPNLYMATDPEIGSVLTARARFDPLLLLLYELASTPLATGLGFQILQSDDLTSALTFSVYTPRDKHIETIFSTELNTARNYKKVTSTPRANYFIIAGGDDYGTNRTIIEGGDSDSITSVGRRVTEFVDKRGVTDTSELLQELAQKLATVVSTDSITIDPTDVPSLTFGDDYDLGDYVTGVVRGISYPRIIRDVEINFTQKDGVVVVPTIADPFGGTDELLAQQFYSLQNRLSNIERNFNVPNDSIISDMLHPTMKWYIADLKMTARSANQSGWLLCNGAAVNRTTYGLLFAQIGTTYGSGDGSTTFNIPDYRNRFPIGAGSTYNLGEIGGSVSSSIESHSHSHSHGGGNLLFAHTHNSQAHDHPGSHSHGMKNHTHTTNINHNHAAFDSGKTNIDSVAVGHATLGTGATDHHHSVDVPALGTTNVASGAPNDNSTDTDSNAPSANYSGSPNGINGGSSWSGGSDSDSTTGGGSSTTVLNPYIGVNYEIYTGVVL